MLTRNRWVQTQISQYLATELGKELGVEVKLSGIEVDFLRNFHLEGVLIRDLYKDTLLYGKTVDFRIQDWDFTRNQFDVVDVDLFGLYFRMGNYDNEARFNYEYIFTDTTEDRSKPKLRLKGSDIQLYDCKYVYFSGTNTYRDNIAGEFNPGYLKYFNVNSEIEALDIIPDKGIKIQVDQLSAMDRTGQNMEDIHTKLSIDGPNLYFEELLMVTGESRINGQLTIQEIPGATGSYFDKFEYRFKTKNARIAFQDLGFYAPYLKTHPGDFKVSVQTSGPLSDIHAKGVELTSDYGTKLRFDYQGTGIPNIPKLEQKINFKESTISRKDIARFFKEESWSDEIIAFGDIKLKGQTFIPHGSYIHNGYLSTELGAIAGSVEVDYSNLDSTLPLRFDGQITQVNAGHWLNIDYPLKGASGDVQLELDVLDWQSNSYFNSDNLGFVFNNRSLHNQQLTAEVIQGVWSLNWVADNDYIGVNANVAGNNLFQTDQTLEMKGDIRRLDLFKLGVDSTTSRYSGEFELTLSGNDWDNYKGNLGVHFARLIRANSEFQLQHQIITRPDLDFIGFKGDWLDGTITGPLKISNTQKWIQQIAHSMAPERFSEVTDVITDSVYLDLHLPQTAWIEEFFVPGLYLGPLAIKGNYFARNNTTDIQIGPLSLEYGKVYMEKALLKLEKPRKNGFVRSSFSSQYVLIENTLYDTLSLSAEVYNGGFQIATKLHDKSQRYSFRMKGNGSIQKKTANLYFTETQLKIYDQIWNLDRQARVNFGQSSVSIQDFLLADESHFVQIEGNISDFDSDTLHLGFGNITPLILTPFFPFHTFDSVGFQSSGSIDFCSLTDEPQFFGDLKINNISYQRQNFGSLHASLSQTNRIGNVQFNALLREGPMDNTSFSGAVQFKKGKDPNLSIIGTVPYGSKLAVIGPFLEGIVTLDSNALFGADMRLTGSIYEPLVKGLLRTNEFRIGIDYLGTKYKTGGNFKITKSGLSTFRPLKFTDPATGNFAWLKLAVSHDNYKDFALDLRLDSIKNLRVLQTTEEMNDIFYGDAWADGSAHIYGLFSEIDMDIQLRTRENTKVAIQYPEIQENNIVGSVVFKDKSEKKNTLKDNQNKETDESDALGQITLDIEANPNADVEFVIDKQLGDIISGKGNGALKLVYGRDENLYLYGRYVIDEGDYTFSLPGINLLKKITLKEGGDIRWDGDPFNAVVNLSGAFEKKISPSTLMISTGNTGASYPATKFVSILNMEGNLFSPQISFDLLAPDLNSTTGASASEVNSVLQRIRSNKDETTRQSIALLLFGNFLPPSFAGAAAPTAGTFSSAGFAGNSISTLASNVVNDLFGKYGIPTRIQVNIDDVRNSTGTSNTQLFVNSEWFLSDRLRLDLNYDPTVAVLVNSVAVPLNFNLEYKTSDENWRLKAFSRSNNLILEQNTGTTTNGVSGNTLGTGVLYRREFDTFKRKKESEGN